MVTRDGKQSAHESKETCQIAKSDAKDKVSPLRRRMIRDMELAGFTGGTDHMYYRHSLSFHGKILQSTQ